MAEVGWKLEATLENLWEDILSLNAYTGQHEGVGGSLCTAYHSEKYGKPSPLGIGNCDAVDRVLAPGVSWRPHAPYFSESVTENRYED